MARPKRNPAGRDGCGYLLFACLAISLLLALNGVLAAVVINWVTLQGGRWIQQSKIAQGFMFVGPVLLIFVEWWLADLVVGRWFPRRGPLKSNRPSEN